MSGIELHESFEEFDDAEESTVLKYNEIKQRKNALEDMLEVYESTMNGEMTVDEFGNEIEEIEENSPL